MRFDPYILYLPMECRFQLAAGEVVTESTCQYQISTVSLAHASGCFISDMWHDHRKCRYMFRWSPSACKLNIAAVA